MISKFCLRRDTSVCARSGNSNSLERSRSVCYTYVHGILIMIIRRRYLFEIRACFGGLSQQIKKVLLHAAGVFVSHSHGSTINSIAHHDQIMLSCKKSISVLSRAPHTTTTAGPYEEVIGRAAPRPSSSIIAVSPPSKHHLDSSRRRRDLQNKTSRNHLEKYCVFVILLARTSAINKSQSSMCIEFEPSRLDR